MVKNRKHLKSSWAKDVHFAGLEDLQTDSFISDLSVKRLRINGKPIIYSFRMGCITFTTSDGPTIRNFTKYRVQVEYRKNQPPKVFIVEPDLPRKNHFHRDDSVCWYKPSKFTWDCNKMTIKNDLFPSFCCWLYFFEVWLDTGIWYGEEAEH